MFILRLKLILNRDSRPVQLANWALYHRYISFYTFQTSFTQTKFCDNAAPPSFTESFFLFLCWCNLNYIRALALSLGCRTERFIFSDWIREIKLQVSKRHWYRYEFGILRKCTGLRMSYKPAICMRIILLLCWSRRVTTLASWSKEKFNFTAVFVTLVHSHVSVNLL